MKLKEIAVVTATSAFLVVAGASGASADPRPDDCRGSLDCVGPVGGSGAVEENCTWWAWIPVC